MSRHIHIHLVNDAGEFDESKHKRASDGKFGAGTVHSYHNPGHALHGKDVTVHSRGGPDAKGNVVIGPSGKPVDLAAAHTSMLKPASAKSKIAGAKKDAAATRAAINTGMAGWTHKAAPQKLGTVEQMGAASKATAPVGIKSLGAKSKETAPVGFKSVAAPKPAAPSGEGAKGVGEFAAGVLDRLAKPEDIDAQKEAEKAKKLLEKPGGTPAKKTQTQSVDPGAPNYESLDDFLAKDAAAWRAKNQGAKK